MAASLLAGLGLLMPAGTALAQNYPSNFASQPPTGNPPIPAGPRPVRTLQFTNDTPTAVKPAGGEKVGAPTGDGGKDGTAYDKYSFEGLEFRNLHEVPGLETLSRVESEAALFERMRQEKLRSNERIIFPDEPPITKAPFQLRHWPGQSEVVEPYFVVHGRLLFEQKDFERGIWNLGVLTPPVCLAKFWWDAALLPYHLFTRPLEQYDTGAGKCLPGDPTPLYLYPEEFSLTGLAAEAGAITALFFIFP
jgi:hypothetical protein